MKDVEIGGKTYTINKFKPTDGRKIVAGYPLTLAPKIGDYAANEQLMQLLMSYVEVHLADGSKMKLTTKALIDNHVPEWDDLVSLEYQTLQANCKFMQGEGLHSFMDLIKEAASKYLVEIMQGAMDKVE